MCSLDRSVFEQPCSVLGAGSAQCCNASGAACTHSSTVLGEAYAECFTCIVFKAVPCTVVGCRNELTVVLLWGAASGHLGSALLRC
jgi:hypothetical protein